MKKLILTLLLFLFISKINAQEAQNIADLDFLYQEIKKLPSYKDQLKGDKQYQLLYESIRATLSDTNELAIYKKMYKLIAPIKDNHLGFYKVADTMLKPRPLKIKLNIDSLTQILKQKPLNNLEGIYGSDQQQFAVFKNRLDEYSVVHLATRIIIGFLIETPNGSLDYISLINGNRGIVLHRNIKHTNGNLALLNLFKTEKPVYNNLKISNGNFEFKKINQKIGYLRLSSFYSSSVNIAASARFFEQVKDSLNTPNLIVDLRNNSGGGFKVSQPDIDLLNKFNGNIYLLQNVKTGSNAEKFIVRLIGKKNFLTLGETTVGTLAYGSNFGNTVLLPNNKFYFYPTDTRDKIDFKYENIGIEPMVKLDAFAEDWIVQTIKLIKLN